MEFLELLLAAKSGDKKSRDLLVEKNMGLVWSVVRRFAHRGYEAEDLFQIGVIGLMKAIDYFDTSYDVRFSTYAVPMISGEIKRFLRDDGMIKVSRSLNCLLYTSNWQSRFREKRNRVQGTSQAGGCLHHPIWRRPRPRETLSLIHI